MGCYWFMTAVIFACLLLPSFSHVILCKQPVEKKYDKVF